MAPPISNPHALAIDAVLSALTLVTRSLSSAQVPEALLINRRISSMREGSPDSLAVAIKSLNILAWPPEYADFRTTTRALAESLPCLCVSNFTQSDKRTATADLQALLSVAQSLQAPEVAQELGNVIEALQGIDAVDLAAEAVSFVK